MGVVGRQTTLRRVAGMTLIEVMVALVIVGLALTAATIAVGQVISSANSMRDRTYANWIAQNQLAEIRLGSELPETGRTTGEVFYAGIDWAWEANVSETGVENLLRVDVAVSFPDREGTIWTVTGFVGPPIIPGQANRAWNANSRRRGATE